MKLHLTTQEHALFDQLSPDLKEGWEVEEEALTFQDTPDRMRVRLGLSSFENEEIKRALEKMSAANSDEEFQTIAANVEIPEMSDADSTSLMYVLGPGGLSVMIIAGLAGAQNDEELKHLAEITEARHMTLESFQVYNR